MDNPTALSPPFGLKSETSSQTALTQSEKSIFLKYCDRPLPRHTSYPAANFWNASLSGEDHQAWLVSDLQSLPVHPTVGLYIHIPYCRSLCSYCGCTREVIPDELRSQSDPANAYIGGLKTEQNLWGQKLRGQFKYPQDPHSPPLLVDKIHLGGGTPTFLTPRQLHELWDAITGASQGSPSPWVIKPDAELAVEVDPRVTSVEHLKVFWDLGFRRISLGVQDFDAVVQSKINRTQSFDLVKKTVDRARDIGFRQINFDLIYGLPGQTTQSILKTLTMVTALAPTRVAFYRLAVMPEIFKWQKTFRPEDLPNGSQTLEFMLLALQYFHATNYQFIGFDHFASAEDSLFHDYQNRTLVRNFQGMTTGSSPITIGLGPSAISSGPSYYAQNAHTANTWFKALSDGLPTRRGYRLTRFDQKRRDLLQDLYCYGIIHKTESLTAKELSALAQLTAEGLLTQTPEGFKVTLLGQLLTRVIGSALDPFLPEGAWSHGLPPGKNSTTG